MLPSFPGVQQLLPPLHQHKQARPGQERWSHWRGGQGQAGWGAQGEDGGQLEAEAQRGEIARPGKGRWTAKAADAESFNQVFDKVRKFLVMNTLFQAFELWGSQGPCSKSNRAAESTLESKDGRSQVVFELSETLWPHCLICWLCPG